MILDHVDGLELSDQEVKTSANELTSLSYLFQGLAVLDRQVKQFEEELNSKFGGRQVAIMGNHPSLAAVPQGMIACAFHWYAVSACNYSRLVGWLTHERDTEKATEYVQQVLPNTYLWRNKVAAHFAITDPRQDDSYADLLASVMFPISFANGSFWANSMTLSVRSQGQTSTSRDDMTWSLTQTHRSLVERFWPDQATSNTGQTA